MRRHGCERGQATVELVALLPLLALLGMTLWQGVVAGQAVWLAGSAARAAARATAVGADPVAAARRALPPALESGLRVEPRDGGAVRVAVGVPAVVGAGRLATVNATAAFPPQS
jgi:hypothetical protein